MMKNIIALLLLVCSLQAVGLSFDNVSDDLAIRANDGTVTIIVSVDRPFGFYINGILAANINRTKPFKYTETTKLTFILENMDRGTHKLSLKSGTYVRTIKIHVLRVHK